MNLLERLQKLSIVVADTGEIEKIKEFNPQDATTNPSLILNASQKEEYRELIDKGVSHGKKSNGDKLQSSLDKIAVNFGKEILQHIPGYVSTEVDARLSFDTQKTIDKAQNIIKLYEGLGVSRDRVLIKIASTWEGIRAAEVLQKMGINCNMTLIFSIYQAIVCAEAKAFLISPFVGRILDWHVKASGKTFTAQDDPGVLSVKSIYNYYKRFDLKTIVMGASFRNIGEILELAGCDRLTISPALMSELRGNTKDDLIPKLNPETAKNLNLAKINADEASFRFGMNEDAMATEKLAEGIRNFAKDTVKLEEIIKQKLDK